MGHLVGKDIYNQLGKKVNNLTVKAPMNDTFFQILKELYSEEEAEVYVKMPYVFSDLDRIHKVSKIEKNKLEKILKGLAEKGLVIDFYIKDRYHYMPSPMVVGIFEFTMMRTDNIENTKKMAKLFHKYLIEEGDIYRENVKNGEEVSFIRTLPHTETIALDDYTEILDYEKAESIIREQDKFSIGICSCRHEKLHAGAKECDNPLDTCSSFGEAADFLIRHNLAREVSKEEMLDNLARSKDLKLVIMADNVQKRPTFMCHCCGCCCNALAGLTKHGHTNIVATSNYIAKVNNNTCTGCGLCEKACPVNAIEMQPISPESKKRIAVVKEDICIGCGVCSLSCPKDSIHLVKRKQRVIHPETSFDRIILQSLERGTLPYQIFDNPESKTQEFMRFFLKAFFNLAPVKKALLSDLLRSTFLQVMRWGAKLQGKGELTKL